jgi:mannosyltransferase OCH1-like enzyme
MIPKTIHYVWVGPKPIPESAQRCLATWKERLPEYQLKLWNEGNSPLEHPYAKRVYARGKWAFASDYIRFKVLYDEGGVYLDTDMEILKPIDRFLNDQAFFGRTSSDGYISCGIIGAVPQHPFIQAILDVYDALGASGEEITSPQAVERAYAAYPNKATIAVYPPEFFYPCNAGEHCSEAMLRNAYATHHWAESWVSFRLLRKALRSVGILRVLKRLRS